MKHFILVCIALVVTIGIWANIIIIDSKPQPEHDAIPPVRNLHMSDDSDYQKEHDKSFTSTTAPQSPARPVAEFEQMRGALIRYPVGIPLELVRQLSLEDKVVTIVANATARAAATTAFNNANVNMENVEFILAATDSYWTRDYGPFYAFGANGELSAINFTYNRPRPQDNAFNGHYATYDTLSIYNMGITHAGGNYMTDGGYIGASTTIAYTENGNNQNLVNERMAEFLGVTEYHVVPDPNNTYIDHIDCWGKFLSPDTVLIRSVPSSHPQYYAIENTANYFANQMSSWGRNFNVVRVNTPGNQPYTNSLIINKRVFVPIVNNATLDNAALQAYQDAMPGYTIIGITNNTSNPWESTDALHCRVKELAERRVVYIDHMPLSRSLEYQDEINIYAEITSFTEHSLSPDSINVYYRINHGDFQKQNMLHTAGQYIASINGFMPGDTLFYYIRAMDQGGRAANHPYIGAPGAHWTILTRDSTPPTITHDAVNEITPDIMPLQISAVVTDNDVVDYVYFEYYTSADDNIQSIEMEHSGEDVYTLLFDISLHNVTKIYYRIGALDSANPPNESMLPFDGWFETIVLSFPMISHNEIKELKPEDMPVLISAKVTDVVGIEAVYFEYKTNEESNPIITLEMELEEDDIYSHLFDIILNGITEIHYRIRALNISSPPNETVLPASDWFVISVITNEFDIPEISLPLQLTVYPNPLLNVVENYLNINVSNNKSESMKLALYNIKGQKIVEDNFIINNKTSNYINWDLNRYNLASGIYFIRYTDSENVLFRRFMILK